MKFRSGSAPVLVAIAAAGVAAAEAAALPDYGAGDTFVYSNGRVEQLAGIEANRFTWATRGGRRYVRDRNFVVPALSWRARNVVGARRVSGKPDDLWPLAVGRTNRFRVVTEVDTRDPDTGRSKRTRIGELWTCRVNAAAPIVVPAGRFDAYEIACDRFSSTTMKVLRREIWHYSPEVGHYVRRETINVGNGKRSSFALVAALSGHEANPARVEAVLAGAKGE
jgi:hypothetical protein